MTTPSQAARNPASGPRQEVRADPADHGNNGVSGFASGSGPPIRRDDELGRSIGAVVQAVMKHGVGNDLDLLSSAISEKTRSLEDRIAQLEADAVRSNKSHVNLRKRAIRWKGKFQQVSKQRETSGGKVILAAKKFASLNYHVPTAEYQAVALELAEAVKAYEREREEARIRAGEAERKEKENEGNVEMED
ncbi:uncharacterized protein LTR77_008198 [Saxophila tyrrhenica]|uniref:Uncharacterized protein n=1 Tax=Saxophila tyrrhenica TaxID=1690608 RepID=A0AAV9P2S4_9PEZI|nr:hypothetical protein LTR77_008198 [Saxophila tyrrhenica]